ncbi:14580_t:CDS:2 [Ambispora leptoticha]|uniref:14580_t:CDS:1 n=1 Tax=Ambispora leptoticha TaxID=144679 RepID=A0A9N8WJL1_9GLOM|nr:14580_t:CDS:2 [Ambispora leptoticha]
MVERRKESGYDLKLEYIEYGKKLSYMTATLYPNEEQGENAGKRMEPTVLYVEGQFQETPGASKRNAKIPSVVIDEENAKRIA